MKMNRRMLTRIGIGGAIGVGVLAVILAVVPHGSNEEPVPQNTQVIFATLAPTHTPTMKPTAQPTQAPVTMQPRVTSTPVPIITAMPTVQIVTVAPATPTVTPPSLQIGFTGSNEVRALQRRLKELGWYSGSVDGDFGPATLEAVKGFQKANGLTVDGKAGEKTLEKLRSAKAVSKKTAMAKSSSTKATAKVTVKPTAKPTATPNLSKDYYLEKGSSGKKVKTLQNRLIELGYLSGKATGEYDSATRAAVLAFQKSYKELWDDGVAGPQTLKLLYSKNARKSSSVAASIGETLQLGSSGSAVRSLQKRLKELGYFSSSIDGDYGDLTENAVKLFQEQNGLTVDGKAGSATLDKLYSNTAEKFKDKE